jgi:hypothetical protein
MNAPVVEYAYEPYCLRPSAPQHATKPISASVQTAGLRGEGQIAARQDGTRAPA